MDRTAGRVSAPLIAALLVAGCSSSSLDRPRQAADQILQKEDVEDSAATQSLFKIRYEGPNGGGSLRLVLKVERVDRFQLTTADTLGRSLWSIDVDGDQTLFLDHRQQVFCLGRGELRLNEPTLEIFSLSGIVDLLQGRLPVDLHREESSDDASAEARDGEGRRWSIRREAGLVTAWTLFVDERPELWWTREGKGGILSHRDGSQFRWRQTVEEPLESSLDSLTAPPSYRQVVCDEYDLPEFRQDQSAPGGEGAP